MNLLLIRRDVLTFLILFLAGSSSTMVAQRLMFHELPVPLSPLTTASYTLFDGGILARTTNGEHMYEPSRILLYLYSTSSWMELPKMAARYFQLNSVEHLKQFYSPPPSQILMLNDSICYFGTGSGLGLTETIVFWNVVRDVPYCTVPVPSQFFDNTFHPVFLQPTGQIRIIFHVRDSLTVIEWLSDRGDTTADERILHLPDSMRAGTFFARPDGRYWLVTDFVESAVHVFVASVTAHDDTIRYVSEISPALHTNSPIRCTADGATLFTFGNAKSYSAGSFCTVSMQDTIWNISSPMDPSVRLSSFLSLNERNQVVSYATYNVARGLQASDGFYSVENGQLHFIGRFENRTTVTDAFRSRDARLTAITTEGIQTSTDGGASWLRIPPPVAEQVRLFRTYVTSDGTVVAAGLHDMYFQFDVATQTFSQIHGEIPIRQYYGTATFGTWDNYSLPLQFEHDDDVFIAFTQRNQYVADERGLTCHTYEDDIASTMRFAFLKDGLYVPTARGYRKWIRSSMSVEQWPSGPIHMNLAIPLSNDHVFLGCSDEHCYYSSDPDLTRLHRSQYSGFSTASTSVLGQQVGDSLIIIAFDDTQSRSYFSVGMFDITALDKPGKVRMYPSLWELPKHGHDKTFVTENATDSTKPTLTVYDPSFTTISTIELEGLPMKADLFVEFDRVRNRYFATSDGRFFQSDVLTTVSSDHRSTRDTTSDVCIWYNPLGQEVYRCTFSELHNAEAHAVPHGLYIRVTLSKVGSLVSATTVAL